VLFPVTQIPSCRIFGLLKLLFDSRYFSNHRRGLVIWAVFPKPSSFATSSASFASTSTSSASIPVTPSHTSALRPLHHPLVMNHHDSQEPTMVDATSFRASSLLRPHVCHRATISASPSRRQYLDLIASFSRRLHPIPTSHIHGNTYCPANAQSCRK
jgi:hypothetical protein